MKFLISGPVFSMSGYGGHARDIALAIIEQYGKDNVRISPTGWGATPDSQHNSILEECVLREALTEQPEIFVQVAIPNEFTQVGKVNIGITALCETNMCSPQWIEGLNRMDMIMVPSNFTKDVILNSIWKDDKGTVVKCTKPVEVLFEGVDLSIYFEQTDIKPFPQLDTIPENFCFLTVGTWLAGDHLEDRKCIGGVIEYFMKAFIDIEPEVRPALVLKITMGTYSGKYKDEMLSRIESIKNKVCLDCNVPKDKLPNVYILHGSLTDEEMNDLYNHPKIKAMVSFTKGEGYGRPLAEWGAATSKPLIVSNWSGHLDFCKPDSVCRLNGTLTQIHPTAVWDSILIKESSWFTVNYEQAIKVLKNVYSKYDIFKRKSKGQHKHIVSNFTIEEMNLRLRRIIDSFLESNKKEVKFVPLK